MRFSSEVNRVDSNTIEVKAYNLHGELVRKLTVTVGRHYIVAPLNPFRRLFRGEVVQVVYVSKDDIVDDVFVMRTESPWHVSRRVTTRLSASDLKPLVELLP